ncbi:holin family protein [Paenibacillus sp. 2RAB27]|uniref:phage holin family protein n=1 Tax=Paenibacillus sp. 2RAB27 TaxID=3232991 RepID=UPI003F94F985
MIKKLFTDLLGISTTQQAAVTTSTGVLGAILTYSFGGWSDLLSLFLWAMVVDYLSGIGASLKEGTGLSSSIGSRGLAKKGVMLLVVMLAHKIDTLFGSTVVMTGAIYFYCANELISITENLGRMNCPLPPGVKQVIQVLKSKGDATNDKGN